VNKVAGNQKNSGSSYSLRTVRALTVALVCAASLITSSESRGAELKQDTLVYWDAYIDAAHAQIVSKTPFLWVDQNPERLQRVREGEILVSSAGKKNPKPVDSAEPPAVTTEIRGLTTYVLGALVSHGYRSTA